MVKPWEGLIRITETAAGLIGELELAAFSLGTAVSEEEVNAAYVGLNAARRRLMEYVEQIESDSGRKRTHKRRF